MGAHSVDGKTQIFVFLICTQVPCTKTNNYSVNKLIFWNFWGCCHSYG